jgi:hypothetical protein
MRSTKSKLGQLKLTNIDVKHIITRGLGNRLLRNPRT